MAICKKIVWDLGEYEVQNKNNYSYEIIDPYLEGCKRYHVIAYYRYRWKNFFNRCQFSSWVNTSRIIVNGDYAQQYSQPFAFNPEVRLDPGTSFANCPGGISSRFYIKQFTNPQCSQFTERYQVFETGIHAVELTGQGIVYREALSSNNPPIKLKIIDGGIESLHSINNRNSVQIIDYECCPPNTLDCGDCCLDCNSIFNSISNIRKSLSQRIR
ncbi:MAG: hypothetical protein EAZ76_10865 [Nostocales cyanobacterium]|nr:MAG: hypothetical protein EAZ87_11820 [Nostocales cyanobacterium]TAF13801.1 MAG: hypothetical protein EAZ76_10865 [Nostocales cyanobacterium]